MASARHPGGNPGARGRSRRAVVAPTPAGPRADDAVCGGNLRKAVERLASQDVRVLHTSRIYETEPVDYKDQAWFLNQVGEAETALFPMQLLTRIGRVEREMGRLRTVRKGPRTIDIDILFYAAAVVETARLEIGRPRVTG